MPQRYNALYQQHSSAQYTLALKDEGEHISIFNDQPVGGSLSMTSVKIG